METLMLVWEGFPHCFAYRSKMVITRVFGITSLESFYDFGRLPTNICGDDRGLRVSWFAERGRDKWLNFQSWQIFRVDVFDRDNGRCVSCGKELTVNHGSYIDVLPFVCDHVLPLFKGGKDWWEDPLMTNFQTLCVDCDKKKTAMDKAVPKTGKGKAKLVSLGWCFERPCDYKLEKFLS